MLTARFVESIPFRLHSVTLIIPARFLNQEPGSYFYWKFQEGIKERIADFDCVRVGVESP